MHVSELITTHLGDARIVVVVSALGGVTDKLEEAIGFARDRSEAYRAIVVEPRERHVSVVVDLVTDGREDLKIELADIWQELEELLDGVYSLHTIRPDPRQPEHGNREVREFVVQRVAASQLSLLALPQFVRA